MASKLKAFIPLTLSIAVLSACTPEKTPEQLLESAQTHITNKDNNSAIIELKNVIQLQPNNAEARFLLGEIYLSTGNGAAAEKELESAFENKLSASIVLPALAHAYYLLNDSGKILDLQVARSLKPEAKAKIAFYQGLVLLAQSDAEQALSTFSKAIEENTDSPFKQLSQAYIFAIQNQSDKALNATNTILEAQPAFTAALLLNGQLLQKMNSPKEAVESLFKYQQTYKDHTLAKMYLASAYMNNQEFEKAEKIGDEIIAEFNDQPLGNYFKGVSRFHKDEYELALLHLNKAIQNGYTVKHAYLLGAISAFSLNQYEQAYKYFNIIKDQIPAGHPANQFYVATLLKLGYALEANTSLTSQNRVDNENEELFAATSLALIKEGHTSEAESLINANTTLDNPLSLVKKGVLKLALGNNEGLKSLEKAYELSPSLPQAKIALAASYLQNKNYEKAIKLADEWIKNEPNQIDGYNLGAVASLNYNLFEQAEAYYQKALKVDEHNTSSLMFFAHKYNKSEDYKNSLTYIDKLLAKSPEYIPALTMNFSIANKLEKTGPALNKIQSAFEANSGNINYRTLLAKAYATNNQYETSIKLLKDIKDFNNTNVDYWGTLVNSQVQSNEITGALDSLNQWIETQPNFMQAWLSKIELLTKLNKTEDALEEIKKAKSHFPQSQRLYILEAEQYMAAFDLANAVLAFANVNEQAKEALYTQKVHGHILLGQKKFNEALPKLLNGYREDKSARIASLVYINYKELKKQDEGFSFLQQHIENQPKDLASQILIANEYIEKGQLTDAKKYYQLTLSLMEMHSLANNNLAWILYKEKKYNEAVSFVEKAIKASPNTANYLDTAGTIKMALGKKQEAIKLFTKATELAPNNDKFSSNLKKAINM